MTPEQARPWLLVIGLNRARNYRRLARHEREVFSGLGEDCHEQAGASSPALLMQTMYGMFRLKRFLGKIGARIRDAVIPNLEGRSVREIAELLGIKTKAVYGRLRLARDHLKTLALA